MTVRHSVVVALLVLGTTVAARQQPPASPGQAPIPTFSTATDAVEFDVFVRDVDGNPVTDLTADDFELLENGAPQPITTFTAVDIPITRPVQTALTAVEEVGGYLRLGASVPRCR